MGREGVHDAEAERGVERSGARRGQERVCVRTENGEKRKIIVKGYLEELEVADCIWSRDLVNAYLLENSV